jgi:RNA polymerase sigma-70 factor (ECF subfamily)
MTTGEVVGTDEALMAAVAAGDTAALEELCRRYERPLYHFLHRHTLGRDVDDLYQETWLRVVRAAGRFDAGRRFSTWVFQIAVNLCRDWRRRQRPVPTDPAALDVSRAGSEDATRTEARVDVQRLLGALPDAQRSVVVLRYYHGFSEADVAEILDCPRGTVKSRLHGAMARLAALARPPRGGVSQ